MENISAEAKKEIHANFEKMIAFMWMKVRGEVSGSARAFIFGQIKKLERKTKRCAEIEYRLSLYNDLLKGLDS